MYRRLLAFFLLFLLAAHPGGARAEGAPACELPPDLTDPSAPLLHVAAALAARSALDILALGSGSTVGDAGGSSGPAMTYHAPPDASFPRRMLDSLQADRPTVHFNLTVKGGRSMTAEMMLPMLRDELAAHHYDLVIWQTGTVEAVQGLRPDVLRGTLEEGARAVDQAQADLVLIDPQFSRFLRANADLSPYETVLQQMAASPGVTLFHRFDLTQTWVNNNEVDLERVGRDQRDPTIVLLNTCLGHALARFIMTGAAEH